MLKAWHIRMALAQADWLPIAQVSSVEHWAHKDKRCVLVLDNDYLLRYYYVPDEVIARARNVEHLERQEG